MFGKKKTKNKISYPETFHYCPGTKTMVYSGASGAVLRTLDANNRVGLDTYKGRFVDRFRTRVELEEFKGVILNEVYFVDDYGNPLF